MSGIDVTFRIGGEAGQGVESSGAGFSSALTRAGLHIIGVPDYYSRIRGGHNHFTIRVCDEPVWAIRETVDVLLALNKETVERHIDKMAPGGAIIVDENIDLDDLMAGGQDVRWVRMPLTQIAEDHGSRVMTNTATLAVAAALVDLGLDQIISVIADNFGKKGAKIVEANRQVAQAAYDMAQERYGDMGWHIPPRPSVDRVALNCSDAFALGAMVAGCKFFAGYPMTPATSIMQYLAAHAAEWGLVVKHAEDEIAAINMCVGAAHTGVRVLTATSGGGFDIMVEGLSLAGMTETPIVLYMAQRPGPATGLATRTGQGDLMISLYSSHGDYPRVLIAPHTPEEAFACAIRAFNLAEKYQCVVIVLAEQYNASNVQSCDADLFDFDLAIDRGKLLSPDEVDALSDYERFAITPDGVSPRAIQGTSVKAVFMSTGNEHRQDGHITEDAQISRDMLDKRMRKLEGIRQEMRPPIVEGPAQSDLTFISWGATYGPLFEAVQLLNEQGRSANMVHFIDLWPFPDCEMLEAANHIVAVEGNATAQLAFLLRAYAGIEVDDTILRYDGRPFTSAYILARVED